MDLLNSMALMKNLLCMYVDGYAKCEVMCVVKVVIKKVTMYSNKRKEGENCRLEKPLSMPPLAMMFLEALKQQL